MRTINSTGLRKDLFNVLSNVIKYNETLKVNTKDDNVIIILEEKYNGPLATLQLSSDSYLKEKIIAEKTKR